MKHRRFRPSCFFLAALLSAAAAYTVPLSTTDADRSVTGSHRRAFLSHIVGTAFGSSAVAVRPRRAAATSGDEEVYFGAGCFWHVQHEFALAEQKILGRSESQWTSLAGYAGGRGADKEGRVCYHNLQSVADYGKLGHGEVVGLSIPPSAIGDFAVEYFRLFGDTGERADPMDKGGEYRSLLGLPGGQDHPMFDRVAVAARERGMTLVDGKGNDPDTLGKRTVFVMDSNQYPFYQAEVCKYFALQLLLSSVVV